jgi:hypothetical protein
VSKFHIATIIALVIIAGIMGALVVTYPETTFALIGAWSGWALLVTRILYEKWDKFYMILQKIKYKFCGLDTLWSLKVNYEIENNQDIIQTIRKTLLNCGLNDLKINQPFEKVLEMKSNGITWEFIDNDGILEIHIFDINVTYNKADRMISKIISPCFQNIERVLNIRKKHYFLSVSFEDNPFIGLYMNKISGKDLINFDITFKLEDQRVEVHKDKIIIHTDSITDLVEISRNILVISPQ